MKILYVYKKIEKDYIVVRFERRLPKEVASKAKEKIKEKFGISNVWFVKRIPNPSGFGILKIEEDGE